MTDIETREPPRTSSTLSLSSSFRRITSRISNSARNAVEVYRLRNSTEPYSHPYDVLFEKPTGRLRHYHAIDGVTPLDASPLLLVPPLMVTSEVYDISPEQSAVVQLLRAGVDVWTADFGAPEDIEGGLTRTLDDHIHLVGDALDEVRLRTGKDVHAAGYSQGGMFCYQLAALRRSAGFKSIIAFGAPVDIRRNLPMVDRRGAEWIFAITRQAIEPILRRVQGLPGFVTSTGFKIVSARKEVGQMIEFMQKLNDRQALERHEQRRRFLAGEGFITWPGPAFRTFIDEFIIHNRMASGGFVLEGRTATLADITCPILYFVGQHDEIVRPAAQRAIREAAPAAEIYERVIPRAGHFGVVVGTKASTLTWPDVIEWIRFRDALGPVPASIKPRTHHTDDKLALPDDDSSLDMEALVDAATGTFMTLRSRFVDFGNSIGDRVDAIRWQLPRLRRLNAIVPDTRISPGLELAEQAAAIPESTFFLWRGRAFTYREADKRVDAVVRGLIHCGVRRGHSVGVLMQTRPSYLTAVSALSRIGATAVLLAPDSRRVQLEQALQLAAMDSLITDPEHAERAQANFPGPVLSLGGSRRDHDLPGRVIDLEAIDPEAVALPAWYSPNPGLASDVAMVLFTAGRAERPRAARITNRRWAFSALGAAAACTLTSNDTVYCCLPLTHAAGMLVAVGGALVGGSRLALSPRFDVETFWPEVRRSGATVVFYAGDVLRPLVEAPPSPLDAHTPVRLFAGSGIKRNVWSRLVRRFGRASVLEFYGSTEANLIMANASGKKVGALGQPLPGCANLALIGWDFETMRFARDEGGRLLATLVDEPGVLIVEAKPKTAPAGELSDESESGRLLRGVFEPGDTWLVTGDLMRRDLDGDYWFVDRVSDVVRSANGAIPTIALEDQLEQIQGVARAAVYGVESDPSERELLVAAIRASRDISQADWPSIGDSLIRMLPENRRPRFIRVVDTLPETDGYRIIKAFLRDAGISAAHSGMAYLASRQAYVRLDAASFDEAMAEQRATSSNDVRSTRRPPVNP